MQSRMPSVKMLCAIARDLTPRGARDIRTVINGDQAAIDPIYQSRYPNRLTRVPGPYGIGDRAELIDAILGTRGVEPLYAKTNDYHDVPDALFCNAGDLYCPTLCYYNGEWRVMCLETLILKVRPE